MTTSRVVPSDGSSPASLINGRAARQPPPPPPLLPPSRTDHTRIVGSLLVSVFVANITVTVIVYTGCIGPAVSLSDAMFVWAYDILWFFFLDIVKLPLTRVFDYAFPVERGRGEDLPDSVPEPAPVSDAGSMLSFCLCTDLGYSFVQDSSSLIGGRFVPAGCSDVADAPGGGGHYTDLGDGPKTNQNKSQRGGAYVPPDVV